MATTVNASRVLQATAPRALTWMNALTTATTVTRWHPAQTRLAASTANAIQVSQATVPRALT